MPHSSPAIGHNKGTHLTQLFRELNVGSWDVLETVARSKLRTCVASVFIVIPAALSLHRVGSSIPPSEQLGLILHPNPNASHCVHQCFLNPPDSQKTQSLLTTHSIQGSARHASCETPGDLAPLSAPPPPTSPGKQACRHRSPPWPWAGSSE